MRLLSSKNLEFVDFDETPKTYAILSHRWYDDHEEVSYQDMCNGTGTQKLGFEKVKKCGEVARYQGCPFFWVDTCCIDKSSSAELSEAINSMYLWYKNATVCYAYLPDVPLSSYNISQYLFKKCTWFSRGWTLQELIAPREVQFLSKEWNLLGTKGDLKEIIHEITGIPVTALQGAPLGQFSVAERMSWASTRKTKRVEDRAYSLMGLFDVNMPLLYGEKEKAFLRLQEEIMKTSDDQSIFAWKDPEIQPEQYSGLLALSPSMFMDSKDIYSMGFWHRGDAFEITNKGIRVRFYMIPYPNGQGVYRASLECWVRDSQNLNAAIYLKRLSGEKESWGTGSDAQFARICANQYDIIKPEEKRKGEYREIFIRQNPQVPRIQLPGSTHSDSRYFRISWPQMKWDNNRDELDIVVLPSSCWDSQTNIFTSPAATGKLGSAMLTNASFGFQFLFGVSSIGEPWVKIMSGGRPYEVWRSYQPTGREDPSAFARSYGDGSVGFSAEVSSTNMYGTSLFAIATKLYPMSP